MMLTLFPFSLNNNFALEEDAVIQKKCLSCGVKIDKGKEHWADVKVTYLKGIHKKAFCGEKCVEDYKEYERNMPRLANLCPNCPP